MTDERRDWAQALDPGAELGLTLGAPVTDAEIDRLCELARSGTAEVVPDLEFTVNRVAGIRGFPAVVIEDPPGRWRLNPDVSGFAGEILEFERRLRRNAHRKQALIAALADLPAPSFRLLRNLCAPPRPLESAVRGIGIDDPDGFVWAVNEAARSAGISEPVVEASAWTVRATIPADLLVGAVLTMLKRESEQRQRDLLTRFLDQLGPDETALIRHLAGMDIADEPTLRRLDPAGDAINEQARSAGLTAPGGIPAVLLRRDEQGRWRVHPATLARLRDLLAPPTH